MEDFRKWMNITAKLYEEQVDEEQIDEVAPLVANAARGALVGAAQGAITGAVGSIIDEDESLNELKDVPEDDPFADEWDDGEDISSLDTLDDAHMKAPHGDETALTPDMVDDESELDTVPDVPGLPKATVAAASDDVSDLIGEIDFYQTNGTSNSDKTYDIEKLMSANPDVIRRIHKLVVG